MKIRLQKRIADSGHCSRRKAEVLMTEGKVKVNGEVVTTLGTKVNEKAKIEVDGKKISFPKVQITVALNKPAEYISSKFDPNNPKTIMDLLPKELQLLKPAGRLDKDSEGLMILSSDGALIQKLTHPKHEHTKTYEIIIKGYAKDKDLAILTKGKIKLDGYTLNPMEFRIIKTLKDRKTLVEIKLNEGRNRQIRRVMDSIGFPVIYLQRTAIGQFDLGDLDKGDHKILTDADIKNALS
ncbi:rRNA pseudouridine synthase [Candidatus Peregrinibacteria bacterium]|jgi:23S rRNA pseudouridine2605 synthase|nr:rRNA pseudouridine synthase [Candidatus Peregrinibacteria bacterium]MBT4632072.1 rRNA pseudouridine synthase [Candidatus Peregrinibacteria bacterium]MBT5516305.1 rRNA pseudouridine synthase [Candidatus Peregrinibacteria bacterium]MBT5823726.1 rRNA pseudouridine synthase [Candidatus Peregrinibacteria bacterium]